MNTGDLRSFFYLENGQIQFSVFDSVKTGKKLDPGFYFIDYNSREGVVELKINPDKETSKTHNFPDKPMLDDLFKAFFNEKVKNKMKSLGFYHKVGILFYGKEGTGKTTIMKSYCTAFIKEHKALVFSILRSDYAFPYCWEFIMKIRNIQNNPIVLIMDEADLLIKDNESYVKSMVDGNMSIDNCVFMASTNYFSNMPKAITNRPSRFKYCIDVAGMSDIRDVHEVVKNMIGDLFSKEVIDAYVNELKNRSLDEIKQFCIDKLMDVKSYNKNKRNIGF